MLASCEVALCARPARLIAALVLAGLCGCAHHPTTTAPPSPPPSPPPAASPAPPRPASSEGPQAGAASAPPATPSPPARAASGTAAQAAKHPAPAHAPPASATPGAGRPPAAAAAASAAPAASPALDLTSLEQRLRDTRAIGLFTKLSLKNQVDDLLAQFRAFYAGQAGLTLASLRRSYELLLMKVVTLLQDEDPGLAGAVTSSREAIWAILSDRNRFNSL